MECWAVNGSERQTFPPTTLRNTFRTVGLTITIWTWAFGNQSITQVELFFSLKKYTEMLIGIKKNLKLFDTTNLVKNEMRAKNRIHSLHSRAVVKCRYEAFHPIRLHYIIHESIKVIIAATISAESQPETLRGSTK